MGEEQLVDPLAHVTGEAHIRRGVIRDERPVHRGSPAGPGQLDVQNRIGSTRPQRRPPHTRELLGVENCRQRFVVEQCEPLPRRLAIGFDKVGEHRRGWRG